MDFDDLDEADDVRMNNQPRQGEVLPLMKRTHLAPENTEGVNERFLATIPPFNGQPKVKRAPKLRLLCFHGVADSLQQAWFSMLEAAPPEIEAIMYVFPGCGHRGEEPLQDHLDFFVEEAWTAFKDIMDTGSFALLGHSIGCLIMTKLAKRAREELNVEPVLAVMMERGACHVPLFSETGLDWLCNKTDFFMECQHAVSWKMARGGSEMGKKAMAHWAEEWKCENETLPVGYHVYKCRILAIAAMYSCRKTVVFEDLEGYDLEIAKRRMESDAYYGKLVMEPENKMHKEAYNGEKLWKHLAKDDKKTRFGGHFPMWTFDEWNKWTEHSEGAFIYEAPHAEHSDVKNPPHYDIIYQALTDIIAKW